MINLERLYIVADQKENLFFRLPYEKGHAVSVSSKYISAEKPDIRSIESSLNQVIQSAPQEVRPFLEGVFDLRSSIDRDLFQQTLERSAWAKERVMQFMTPDSELKNVLSETRLQSDVKTKSPEEWFDNYLIQVASLRSVYLRSLAKRGMDPHGKQYYSRNRQPEDHPHMMARRSAADELLSNIDWDAHAQEILNQAEDAIRENAARNGQATIAVSTFVKDYSLPQTPFNVFTDSYIKRLTRALHEAAEKTYGVTIKIEQQSVLMLTNTDRTNATALTRLTKQPDFKRDYPYFDGKLVVLADDHIDAGACMAGLHTNIRQNGGTVIAVSAYSRHPRSASLQASRKIQDLLKETAAEEQINEALEEIGLGLETVTQREAEILAAILIDGRNEEQKIKFDQACSVMGTDGHHSFSSLEKDIYDILMTPPRHIKNVKAALREGLLEARHMNRPVLMDLDDFLIDSGKFYEAVYEEINRIAVEELGFAPPKRTYKEKGQQTGREYLAQEYGAENADRLMKIREERILLGNTIVPQLLPGAAELLQYLYVSGKPHAIVSDTPQTVLNHFVERIAADLGIKLPLAIGRSRDVIRKPDPSGILKAMDMLKVKESDRPYAILFGDYFHKDGEAARRAGIQSVIVPNGKLAEFGSDPTLPNLHAVLTFLKTGKLNPASIQSPPYVVRKPYGDTPFEETEIITSGRCFTESPTSDGGIDFSVFTAEEREIHKLRWIAKRARDPEDEDGKLYTVREQFAAAAKVIHGFFMPGGQFVPGLMTDDMVQKKAVQVRRHYQYSGLDHMVIHLPERSVNPPKPIENRLSTAFNQEFTRALREYCRIHYPDMQVEFDDASRSLLGISMQKALDASMGLEDVRSVSLSGHDLSRSVQFGRAKGTLLERILKQPLFDFMFAAHELPADSKIIRPGDAIILTDDCVQAGGTFLAWFHALKERGAHVLGFVALSTIPESSNLQAASAVLKGRDQMMLFTLENYLDSVPGADQASTLNAFDKGLDILLAKVGLSWETLSNREALSLMAFFIDGRKQEQLNWFSDMARAASADLTMPQRDDENLILQAKKPPETPCALAAEIVRGAFIPQYVVHEM